VLVENDYGRFAITPSQVTQQLIDSLRKFLLSIPNPALRHKRSPNSIFNPDVGLSAAAKRLTRCVPLIMPIEVRKKYVSEWNGVRS